MSVENKSNTHIIRLTGVRIVWKGWSVAIDLGLFFSYLQQQNVDVDEAISLHRLWPLAGRIQKSEDKVNYSHDMRASDLASQTNQIETVFGDAAPYGERKNGTHISFLVHDWIFDLFEATKSHAKMASILPFSLLPHISLVKSASVFFIGILERC